MTLHAQELQPVPAETARVAHAAFPHGNVYMRMRDHFGALYSDQAFVSLFPTRGQPAETPARLALVTVMQFAEGLSDRQAADAVRGRIDWKYTLGLELTDPGFDASVLSEFRSRLVVGGAELLLLDTLLTRFRAEGLLKARGRQRTDSTHVLGAIRAMNRLECVGEALRFALSSLATEAPDWLSQHIQPDWVERYGHRVEDYRLPSGQAKRQTMAETIGRDGLALLSAVSAPDAPVWLRRLPALETMRRIWIQNYLWQDEQLHWRANDNIPPAAIFISSPYDPEAHYSQKGSTSWIGYKVHLTETIDEGTPHLITNVATTAAPVADGDETQSIHQQLQTKGLLPSVHVVDTGYVDSKLLVSSHQDYGVELLGPTRADYQWQARAAQGFAAHDFQIDWQAQHAICPQGNTSINWTAARDNRGTDVIKIKFSSSDCRVCPSRSTCTRSTSRHPRRTLTVRLHDRFLALQAARIRQGTPEFKSQYAQRAGIEGTLSQGVRTLHLRRARYVGLAKTHLQHILTAAAINLVRVSQWLAATPLARTRRSAFQRLCESSTPA